MVPLVFVRVVGFTDVERHALNTVFRLSQERPVSYTLWTPEAPLSAHLSLIDVDSHEGQHELALPGHDSRRKLICVGEAPPAHAWRVFKRPLNWPDVVRAMDELFMPPALHAGKLDEDAEDLGLVSPGEKLCLLVDDSSENRLYLRARLALAGLLEVHDAATAADALDMARRRHYALVVASLDIPDLDGWKLVERLVALEPDIGSVVLTTTDTAWHTRERAEGEGCFGVLERPFDPLQVSALFKTI